uniref:Uncharacterized protein n=1 Tax=Clytia hemisphaerica TaxID=252671 RepID=A0A7M5XES4_9CNID
IHNMNVTVINHLLHDPKSAIIDIDINKSILRMKDIIINIQNMNYSKVAAIHLKFVTKSPNVLQKDHGPETTAIKLVCPESYFPSKSQKLRAYFFTHVIDCVPCPRGLYNLHRGVSDIRYVNNMDFDTLLWKNGNRKLLIENPSDVRKCIKCPPGGNCTYGIKSQGNHFGQSYSKQQTHQLGIEKVHRTLKNMTTVTTDSNNYGNENNIVIEFISCPPGYCCSNQGQRCQNITSCNYHRQ